MLAHYCGAAGPSADEGEFSADDYREMVGEMEAQEVQQACAEEGVRVDDNATREELRGALLAHYCGAAGAAAAASAVPLAPCLVFEIVVDESEFTADDYREMVGEMEAEEVQQACAEEGVRVDDNATLGELREALLAHYCGTSPPAAEVGCEKRARRRSSARCAST